MQWTKVFQDNSRASRFSVNSTAEVVGQKIYIQHDQMEEFTIFDPGKKHLWA